MKAIVLLGRILFSLIFIMGGFNHFKKETISYGASHGVIMPEFLIPAAGILAIVSGLSILLGFKAKWGAWGLVLFLVPVTLTMHNFWTVTDPMQHMTQMTMFMKNTSMLGGALLITYFGAGPLSLDAREPNNKPEDDGQHPFETVNRQPQTSENVGSRGLQNNR
jgi:putative oxidoreductase